MFKQVHGFQVFCSNHLRQLHAENPQSRQPSTESLLEAARSAGLNVGNLNVKVLDRWYETGWFNLFKKRYVLCALFLDGLFSVFPRYREDPKTGLPAPYYGPPDEPMDQNPGPSSASHSMGTIDPQLVTNTSAHLNTPSHSASYATVADVSQQYTEET